MEAAYLNKDEVGSVTKSTLQKVAARNCRSCEGLVSQLRGPLVGESCACTPRSCEGRCSQLREPPASSL